MRSFRISTLRQIDQDKDDEISRACSKNRAKWNAYTILVGKPEGKRPLERPT
jgi:hypothetical protein